MHLSLSLSLYASLCIYVSLYASLSLSMHLSIVGADRELSERLEAGLFYRARPFFTAAFAEAQRNAAAFNASGTLSRLDPDFDVQFAKYGCGGEDEEIKKEVLIVSTGACIWISHLRGGIKKCVARRWFR